MKKYLLFIDNDTIPEMGTVCTIAELCAENCPPAVLDYVSDPAVFNNYAAARAAFDGIDVIEVTDAFDLIAHPRRSGAKLDHVRIADLTGDMDDTSDVQLTMAGHPVVNLDAVEEAVVTRDGIYEYAIVYNPDTYNVRLVRSDAQHVPGEIFVAYADEAPFEPSEEEERVATWIADSIDQMMAEYATFVATHPELFPEEYVPA